MRVEAGQRWTFVSSSGKRTEYVVGNPTDPEFMSPEVRDQLWAKWEPEGYPHSIVYLLNKETGKYAMVTHFWLRSLPHPDGRSHWLPPMHVEAAA